MYKYTDYIFIILFLIVFLAFEGGWAFSKRYLSYFNFFIGKVLNALLWVFAMACLPFFFNYDVSNVVWYCVVLVLMIAFFLLFINELVKLFSRVCDRNEVDCSQFRFIGYRTVFVGGVSVDVLFFLREQYRESNKSLLAVFALTPLLLYGLVATCFIR